MNSFGYFLACMGVDVLFFFALGFFTAPVSLKMKHILLQITTIFATALKDADRNQTILDALFSINTMPFWKTLSLYALLFVFIIYLVYIIFQSIAWNLSLRIINKKIPYWKYLKSFAILNIFWFVILILYNLADLLGDLRNTLNTLSDVNFISIFANFFLLIFIYFAVISYTNLSLKKAFRLGWKKYRPLLTYYVLVIIYFFVLNLILSELFRINYIFAVIIGLILFLPAITWARVFMALQIEKVK